MLSLLISCGSIEFHLAELAKDLGSLGNFLVIILILIMLLTNREEQHGYYKEKTSAHGDGNGCTNIISNEREELSHIK